MTEDGDLVGHDARIGERRSTGKGDALVETKKGARSPPHLLGRGPVLDDHRHVLHQLPQARRKAVEGVGHQLLELCLTDLHGPIVAAVHPPAIGVLADRESALPSPVGMRASGHGGNTALAEDADASMQRTILLVSGSLRQLSTHTALLRTAARVVPEGVDCRLYDRLGSLPAFNPDEDRDPLHPEVQRLRDAIHQADAIIFSTPEYAGALPGSLKNLLDWTIGDEDPGSIYEKPVGWVNASPRDADGAHSELRTVLSYANARLIDTACAQIPVTSQMVGLDGLVEDDGSRSALGGVVTALVTSAIPASAVQPQAPLERPGDGRTRP